MPGSRSATIVSRRTSASASVQISIARAMLKLKPAALDVKLNNDVLVRQRIRVEVARRQCFAEGPDGAGRDPADVAAVRTAGVRANGSPTCRFRVDRATLETTHAFEHCEVQRFVSRVRLHVQRRLRPLRKLAYRSCRDSYCSKDVLVWSTGTRTASQAVPPHSGQPSPRGGAPAACAGS